MPRQAVRSSRRCWIVTSTAAALLPLAGCENDSGKADRRVQDQLTTATAQNTDLADGRAKAQQALDLAKGESAASPSYQLRTRALLGDAELRQATEVAARVGDNSTKIQRLIGEITQLAAAATADDRLVDALGRAKPDVTLAKLKDISANQTGSDDKPDWTPTAGVTLAAQAAADKAVSGLEQQVSALQDQITTDTKAKTDLSTKADQLRRQSEQEQHEKSVDLFTQSATAHKDASDLSAKIEQENGQLSNLKADLVTQQAQQAAVKVANTGVDARVAEVNKAWADTQAQIKQVQAHTATLVGGGEEPTPAGKPTPMTISAKSTELAKLRQANDALRREAEGHYNSAIAFYRDAYDQASQLLALLNDPKHQTGDRPKRPDIDAWAISKAATEPNQFRYLQGIAQLDRAEFYSRAAAENQAFANLVAVVKPALDHGSAAIPDALNDANGDAAHVLETNRGLAKKGFADATDSLVKVSSGGSSVPLQQAARVADAIAEYGWSLLASGAGDAQEAAVHMTQARTAQENAANLPGPMPALPPAPMMSVQSPAAEPAAH